MILNVELSKLLKEELIKMILSFSKNHPTIIHELGEYCEWHNCGISDEIDEAYFL